jgi:hypothetical protein
MTDHDQITQFYTMAAKAIEASEKSGADRGAALLDAAASVFDRPEEYAPFIVSLATSRGIEIAGKLAELHGITAEAKRQAQREKETATAKEAVTLLAAGTAEYAKFLAQGHAPDEKEMTEAAAAMGKAVASLATPKEQSRFISFAEYLADCKNYDPDKDFTPALFGVPFPDGTVSYIGARTSRGKTAAMLNLTREAITAEKPRRVFFITLEMSPKQLLTRLALSLVYGRTAGLGAPAIKELEQREKPMRDYYRIVRGLDIEGWSGGHHMAAGTTAAIEKIKAELESRNLVMYDARGAGLETIISTIKGNAEKGTVILLDYIQRMPSPEGVYDSTYMRVKGISDRVLNAAAVTDAVIIAGAQFNRQNKDVKGKSKRDTFDDTSFRESGDLEQDAHCAIGLGWWDNNKDSRFFEVLKVRDGEIPKHPFKLTWRGAFQYMANSGEAITEKEEPATEATEKKETVIRGGRYK